MERFMSIMRIVAAFIMLLLAAATVSAGEYVTPGDGGIFTLSGLAPLSGGVLVPHDGAWILEGRLVISTGDTLTITSETILVKPTTPPDVSQTCIRIRGALQADRLIMASLELEDRHQWRNGIVVNGGAAVMTNSRFDCLRQGLWAFNGASLTVDRSHFSDCCQAGLFVMGGSEALVSFSTFTRAHPQAQDSRFQMLDSTITGTGLVLKGHTEEMRIVRCQITDVEDTGCFIQCAGDVRVEAGEIARCAHGMQVVENVTPLVIDTRFTANRYGAVVVEDNALPVFRRNVFMENSIPDESFPEASALPVFMISTLAAPDLGNSEEPGGNVFQNNGPLAIYHAGTLDISAEGNLWGANHGNPGEIIYHEPDDDSDADESGFVSGRVIHDTAGGIPKGTFLMMK